MLHNHLDKEDYGATNIHSIDYVVLYATLLQKQHECIDNNNTQYQTLIQKESFNFLYNIHHLKFVIYGATKPHIPKMQHQLTYRLQRE